MKNVNVMGAQGDVLFIKISSLPPGLTTQDHLVVAHSETGHNHEVEVLDRVKPKLHKKDDMISYLEILSPFADIVHKRNFDTHETLRLEKGIWEIRRQREYTPQGYRRVED